MATDPTTDREPTTSFDRRHAIAVFGALALFGGGALMLAEGIRVLVVTPGLPPQPLFELVAVAMGTLAILYAGLLSAWLLREARAVRAAR